MIIRIQTGSSFKGAGLYYLHDKKLEGETERFTSERLEWTHALNTLEQEPQAVLDEMHQTAANQQLLKCMSGNSTDGRPTELTVMTVALSWAEDQRPDKQQMIDGACAYLKHMGWAEHQTLIVAHNDTKHRHVHLIINRIHHETGMTLDANWAKTRSQRWALAYEKEQGRVYCEARQSRYEHDHERASAHLSRRDWRAWQEIVKESQLDPEYRKALEAGEWDSLKDGHKKERVAFWKETTEMRNRLRDTVRVEVREQMARAWGAYAVERVGRVAKARLYDQEARRGIRHARRLSNSQKVATRQVPGVLGKPFHIRMGREVNAVEQIKERQKAFHDRMRHDLAQRRASLNSKQGQQFIELAGPALNFLMKDRLAEYKELLARQRGERSELRSEQKAHQRSPHVLDKYRDPNAKGLTDEQVRGYVVSARAYQSTGKDAFGRTAEELGRADSGRASLPQAREAGRETTDQMREKRDKDQMQEAKRRSGVEWFLHKRAHDRARERDGGRDR